MNRVQQTAFSFMDEGRAGTAPRLATAQRAAMPVLRPARPARPVRPTPIAPPAGDSEVQRQHLERRIAAQLPSGRLALTVTDNRYTMISVKREKGLYRLRLHHMFLEAAPEVVRALGSYVGENDRDASAVLGRFIDGNQHQIRRARRRRPPAVALETLGEVHDLEVLYHRLNQHYFGGRIQARITWGQRATEGGRKRRRNSIKMGSYSVEDRLIRIHPSLDRPFVPAFFVEWIVYHEMLHQKHDIPVVGGRRQFHTPEFMEEEAAFEQFERARKWERENLDRLLVY